MRCSYEGDFGAMVSATLGPIFFFGFCNTAASNLSFEPVGSWRGGEVIAVAQRCVHALPQCFAAFPRAFAAVPCASTAFVAKTLPLPCASTALPLPLPCASTS